jgi:hypothetical protein
LQFKKEENHMQEFVTEDALRTREARERPPFSRQELRPHPLPWEYLRAWIKQKLAKEETWELIFVSAALATWGWYVFWLYQALQGYTIVPLP